MPTATPRLCNRCQQIVTGTCPHCTSGWDTRPPRDSWGAGPGRAKTGHRKWRALRTKLLDEDPYCATCGAPANQVDHLPGTDYEDSSGYGRSWLNPAMTRPMCTPCHRRKTSQDGNRVMRGL